MKTKTADLEQKGKVSKEDCDERRKKLSNEKLWFATKYLLWKKTRERESRVIERERPLSPMSRDLFDEGVKRTVRKARKSW